MSTPTNLSAIRHRLGAWAWALALGASVAAMAVASTAAVAAPVMDVSSHHAPTAFQPDAPGTYTFLLSNVGDAPVDGVRDDNGSPDDPSDDTLSDPVTVEIALPVGVTTRLDNDLAPYMPGSAVHIRYGDESWDCTGGPDIFSAGASSVRCTMTARSRFRGTIPVGQSLRLSVYVQTDPVVSGTLSASATVSGGGAESVALTESAPVGPNPAAFGIEPGTFIADAFDAGGGPERQAGSHPFRASAGFDLDLQSTTAADFDGVLKPAQRATANLRSLEVTLPRGFIGNPTAVAQCTAEQLLDAGSTSPEPTRCPPASQIGTIDLTINSLGGLNQAPVLQHVPVYNMVPQPGVLADIAFSLSANPVHIRAYLDPVDYSVTTRIVAAPEFLGLQYQRLTLWGVPADPAHDGNRWSPMKEVCYSDGLCQESGDWGAASTGPVAPFLTLPSECGQADAAVVSGVDSWQRPGEFLAPISATLAEAAGCADARMRFRPIAEVHPTSTAPDAPTGLETTLTFPPTADEFLNAGNQKLNAANARKLYDQNGNAAALATPPLKRATVTLPEGMTINPAGADGLQACTDAQLRLGTNLGLKSSEPSCPEASRIGSVTATSPALEDPIEGGVYIRPQNSSDPQSGEMFRLALVLQNKERGVIVKLPGSVKADPQTGRIETSFDNNPQLPVEKIVLRLKSGDRAPLANPSTCGVKTIDAELTAWSGHKAQLTDSYTIPCPATAGFTPGFSAGSTNPIGGAFSPFVARIERAGGEQYLNQVNIDMPAGLLAKLKGVEPCPDAVAGDGTPGVCPAGSRIGTATVRAGSGKPFVLQGPVYLTGPYKGGPYGLSVQVPAQAGPFDLGMVKVRSALHVDPVTAQVSVVSDALPQIVKGVPVRLRGVEVDIDRDGFTINPTSCAAKSVDGMFKSVADQTAAVSARYQVGECAALDPKPSLVLSLSGKGQTTDGKHPAVTANLTQPFGGQANLKKVRVALPLSLALDPDNANGLCEFVDGSKVEPTCPKASIVGTATAVTPILDQPMTGPVYFVKNIRKDAKTGREIRTLPKLVIPLTGQNGLRLNLTGTSAVEKDQLVTTFDNLPDAPVSSFKLNINGGKGGILVVSDADICKSTQVADQQVDGQNGKRADSDVSIQTPSCPLKVLSKKVGKGSVAVKIGGLGAGKVTMTGRGIKKTTKTITKSTVATITAKRTKGKPGRVTVSFDPTGPAKPRKTTK